MAKSTRGGKIGSSGGAGTPTTGGRSDISQTKDLQELADLMFNKYDIRVDTKSLAQADFDAVKKSAETIAKMKEEFPEAEANFHELNGNENKGNAYASASYYGLVQLNPNKYKDAQKIAQSYAADVKSKFHPDGTTSEHIVTHECGHILEKALIDKNISDSRGGIFDMAKKADAWNKHKAASDVISRAAKNAKKTPEGKGKKIGGLIGEVSRYATKNRSETLAECVADYVANGSNAKLLSREVWKVLKSELG